MAFMRRVRRLPILLALAVAAVLPATATGPGGRVFYVRQTVGDDANDGTSPGQAWRTLSMLENAMQAGDTAHVGPGLYREQIVVAHSGAAGRPITFIADASGEHTGDPPGIVMIAGGDVVDETTFTPHSSPGVYVAPSPEGTVWSVVEMDGPQYRYKSARDTPEYLQEGVAGLEVVAGRPSSFYYDRSTREIYIHTSDGEHPVTHEIELIRRNNGIATFGKHHVHVIGFTFRHMGTAAINFDRGSSHCVALDNTSYGGWQGIRVFDSDDVLIQGNTMFGNGNSGAYFLKGSKRVHAVGNVAYDNAKGIRWSSESDDGMALDNVLFENRETGIAIERARGILAGRNTLVRNSIAQIVVRKGDYFSERNCFEVEPGEQLFVLIDHFRRYEALETYRRETGRDGSSVEGCGRLPKRLNVHKLHARTTSYAERARKRLARRSNVAR